MQGKKIKVLLITVVAIVFAAPALAQPPDTLWTICFGGSGDDYAYAIQQTADGNFAFFGRTSSWGAGMEDFWALKMDDLGNAQWSHTYGGSERNLGFDGQQTADGGYVLVGQIGDYPSADAWLVKTDAGGNQTWAASYNYSSHDHAESVWQNTDGGYIMNGNHNGMYYNIWTIRTDANGSMLWNREFGIPAGNDEGKDVQQTSDGNFILLNTIHVESWAYNPRIWLTKMDPVGNTLWNVEFGAANQAYGHSVQQTSDGGYIFTGWTNPPGAPADLWLVKTDGSGNMLWNRTFGGNGSEEGYCVRQTTDGGYIIAGCTSSYGAGGNDVWIIKTDDLGNMQWNCAYGGAGDDVGHSVWQTADAGYIVGGYTNSFGAGGYDAWVLLLESAPQNLSVNLIPFSSNIQIPASGGAFEFYVFVTNGGSDTAWVDLWTKAILPNGTAVGPLLGAANVALDPGVTGWVRYQNVPGRVPSGLYTYIACAGDYPSSIWASDSLQFTKLATGDGAGVGDWANWGDPLIGQAEAPDSRPATFVLHRPAPNPFNPATTIAYSLPEAASVKLQIFDVSGRGVSALADGWQDAGEHSVVFDASGLPSGIYFARLSVAGFNQTQKLLLVK